MARCEICGKGRTIFKKGRHRQTKNVAKHGSMGLRGVKSSKTIHPNVRKVQVEIEKGKKIRVVMCMGCYKRFRKDESFKARVFSICSARCPA